MIFSNVQEKKLGSNPNVLSGFTGHFQVCKPSEHNIESHSISTSLK